MAASRLLCQEKLTQQKLLYFMNRVNVEASVH